MSIRIWLTLKEGGNWEPFHVSGATYQDILGRGMFGDVKVYALKKEDGSVYDFVIGKWRDKK